MIQLPPAAFAIMSRAFVKETDNDTAADLPELPVSSGPNPVTMRGLALLRTRQDAIRLALTELDLSLDSGTATGNHASLTLAGQKPAMQRELRWLDARLATAQLRQPPARPHSVEFGCRVTLIDEHDGCHVYRIVGEEEAAPEQGRISWRSPLATALQGARIGDEVVWQRPAGNLRVEITDIDGTPELIA